MNQLLQVKLRFSNESNSQRPNGRNLRMHAETSIEKIDDNTYLVLGNTSIQEINRELDLDIERNDQYNSIAGLIAYHLEYIPEIDEVIELKEYGISLKIIRKDKNRIVKVELSKIINDN